MVNLQRDLFIISLVEKTNLHDINRFEINGSQDEYTYRLNHACNDANLICTTRET